MDLDLCLSVAPDKSVLKHSEGAAPSPTQVLVKGLVSQPTPGSGRSTGSRQFFFINGRPFAPARIAKAFNEVYKGFAVGSFPCVVADFQLPPDAYDVNVSPDKRSIFLHSEGNLVAELKRALEEAFQPAQGRFEMRSLVREPTKGEQETQEREKRRVERMVEEEEGEEVVVVKSEEEEESPSKRRRLSEPREEDAPILVEQPPTSEDVPLVGSADVDTGSRQEDQLEPPITSEAARPEPEPRRPIASTSRTTLDVPPPRALRRTPSPEEALISDVRTQVYSQPTLLQMTLDTSGASWAVKRDAAGKVVKPAPVTAPAPRAAGGGSKLARHASREMEKATRHIRQFVHPSEVRKYIDDEAAHGGGYEEEEELEEEGDVEGLIDDRDEDDMVIDETATQSAPQPTANHSHTQDDCGCSGHSLSDPPEPFSDNPATEAERLEHLTALNLAGESEPAHTRPEVLGVLPANRLADQTVAFDIFKLMDKWETRPTRAAVAFADNKRYSTTTAQPDSTPGGGPSLAGASVEGEAAGAEAILSRTVAKEDFGKMQVVGQFNLGFIIARRRAAGEDGQDGQDDLFIVDQHASDEKYNFERLQAETVIQSQRLLA